MAILWDESNADLLDENDEQLLDEFGIAEAAATTWWLWNDKVLIDEFGRIAIDQECCCETICCPCEWLQDYVTDAVEHSCTTPPGKGRIKITIEGAGFSGYCIYSPTLGGPLDDDCLWWDQFQECSDDCVNLVNVCGFVFELVFGCNRDGSFHFRFNGLTSDCSFPDPVQVELDCGPPLYAVFQTTAINAGGGCPAECQGLITITVESIDPWPLP